MKTCLLCLEPIEARGLCLSHYRKAQRLGVLAAFPRRVAQGNAAWCRASYERYAEQRRAEKRAAYARRKAA